jgi:hypothetical protein
MAKKKKIEPIIEDQIDLTAPSTEAEPSLPSTGLGDTVAKLTKAFGIEPCDGCKSRQSTLNKLFPYLNPSRLLSDDETAFVNDINSRTQMSSDEANRLFALYNEVFPTRSPIRRCNCPGLIMKLIQRLHTLANINKE